MKSGYKKPKAQAVRLGFQSSKAKIFKLSRRSILRFRTTNKERRLFMAWYRQPLLSVGAC